MTNLKVMGVILVVLVVFDHMVETSTGWVRVRVFVPVWKKELGLQCPEFYGVACKETQANVGTEANLDFSGTGCKMSPNKACSSQTRQLSSITPDGLQYVPLPSHFDYYDVNGDKKITFDEFSAQLLARYQIQDQNTLKTMFAAADVNGDGVLEPDEFSTAPFIHDNTHFVLATGDFKRPV